MRPKAVIGALVAGMLALAGCSGTPAAPTSGTPSAPASTAGGGG